MTDPIPCISMILGLIGIYTLFSSFGDDNGEDGESYIYDLAIGSEINQKINNFFDLT